MTLLEKVRALPDPQRKIIFWLILIIVSLLLLFFWAKRAKVQLEKLKGEEIESHINLPSFGEIKFPEIKMEEELKKLEELMEEQKNAEE